MRPRGARELTVRSRAVCAGLAAALVACSSPSGPKPAEVPRASTTRSACARSGRPTSGLRSAYFPARARRRLRSRCRATTTRLDQKTGERHWRVGLDLLLSGGVGADEGTVAVASEAGCGARSARRQGARRARVERGARVPGGRRRAGARAQRRQSGVRIRRRRRQARWVYQRAVSSLLGARRLALRSRAAWRTPASRRQACGADARDRALRWEATVAVPKGATELERVADVMGAPAVQGREVRCRVP